MPDWMKEEVAKIYIDKKTSKFPEITTDEGKALVLEYWPDDPAMNDIFPSVYAHTP